MRSGEAAKIVLDLKGDIAKHEPGFRGEAARRTRRRSKRAGTYKHLAAHYDADGAGSSYGRSGRRHRALEQQLLGPFRPARSRRSRKAGPGQVRRRNGFGALHLRNVRHPSRSRGSHRGISWNAEASLSYVACWNANTGLFATICDRGFGDHFRRAQSRVDHRRRALGDQSEARTLQTQPTWPNSKKSWKRLPSCFPILVVTDGVFSMEGRLGKASGDRRPGARIWTPSPSSTIRTAPA